MGGISTRMTECFGCRHPFAGAGMAFAGGTADLALGVCAGGGIGAVGVGLTPAEPLRAIIHETRATTEAPFNINLITFFDNDAQIRIWAEEKVPVNRPLWRDLPSCFLIAEQDRMIVPDTQRFMAERMHAQVRSHPVDHTPMVTAPGLVVVDIRQAIGEAISG